MITVSKEDLKKNNLPTITSSKITVEQARTLAQIIYHLLEADATEQDTDNVAEERSNEHGENQVCTVCSIQ